MMYFRHCHQHLTWCFKCYLQSLCCNSPRPCKMDDSFPVILSGILISRPVMTVASFCVGMWFFTMSSSSNVVISLHCIAPSGSLSPSGALFTLSLLLCCCRLPLSALQEEVPVPTVGGEQTEAGSEREGGGARGGEQE